jgi:hypothetical protein
LIDKKRDLKEISKERLRKSVVTGIPPQLRGEIWCLLCNTEEESNFHSADLYKKLLDIEDPIEEHKISKDIKRTLPELRLFHEDYKSGGNKLYNVLKAYSSYDNEIGYAQGVNYLAAMLLIHIEDEIKAFWCLINLLYRRNWRMIYDDNTPKLMSLLDLLRTRML